jgi:hypothetical protein
MSSLFRQEEALASMSYPRTPYYLMGGYSGYGADPTPAEVLAAAKAKTTAPPVEAKKDAPAVPAIGFWGAMATGFKAVWDTRQQERYDLMTSQINTYARSRQDIYNAKTQQKAQDLEAEKSKYIPVYLAAGLVGIGVIALTMKQIVRG